uniref:Ribosome-recycling factor, chloroplastic n=1 Tax=Davidia involucrata TaxID=16924 RepID=A0A5B7AD07_DAVIN
MSFSPATPLRTIYQQPINNKPNPPKTLLSLQDTYYKGRDCTKCNSTFRDVFSWSSVANYVTLRIGTRRFTGQPYIVKQSSEKRTGIFKCATIEEIEAEKSLIEKDVKQRMEKTIETVRSNFNSIRTGRANPAILDRVEVEYYGSPVSLKSIAQISTPDASSLLVQPYDKSSLKAIEKAIVSSDLGLTPNNDGEVIRLSLPQLTSDRRKELLKVVAKQTEEGKVALRNIRRDAIKAYEKLEKEKKLSEDNVKDLSSDLQKVIDEFMKKIDSIYKQKEKELLTV